MQPRFSNQRNNALTLTEVLVVIVALAFLIAVFFPWPEPYAKKKVQRMQCVENLKQIGIATRIWEPGQSDRYPMLISVTNGGTLEYIASGEVFRHFQVLSNEVSTPKILICPADTNRLAATNFTTNFNNNNISYFVGLDADEEYPQRIIYGDCNFEISSVPIKLGLLELPTNTPIAWTAARHKFVGNILLTDGSVQWVNNSDLTNLFQQTGLATNRLAIP